MRTCIACRENKSKRELLRVVRTPEGQVLIDATGKKSGRGAYLCARLSCWQKALKEHRLEQVFETQISPEDRAALDEYVETLPKDEPASVTAKKPKVPVNRKSASETKA
nr:YlxR family protein [Dictyobacter vulcani]